MAKVYSTDQGRLCPVCEQPVASCRCKTARQTTSPKSDAIYIRRETSGRKGAAVTLVEGLPLPADELKATAKKLKALCGSGGTVKNGNVELQGDHRQKVGVWLQKQGYPIKFSGG